MSRRPRRGRPAARRRAGPRRPAPPSPAQRAGAAGRRSTSHSATGHRLTSPTPYNGSVEVSSASPATGTSRPACRPARPRTGGAAAPRARAASAVWSAPALRSWPRSTSCRASTSTSRTATAAPQPGRVHPAVVQRAPVHEVERRQPHGVSASDDLDRVVVAGDVARTAAALATRPRRRRRPPARPRGSKTLGTITAGLILSGADRVGDGPGGGERHLLGERRARPRRACPGRPRGRPARC